MPSNSYLSQTNTCLTNSTNLTNTNLTNTNLNEVYKKGRIHQSWSSVHSVLVHQTRSIPQLCTLLFWVSGNHFGLVCCIKVGIHRIHRPPSAGLGSNVTYLIITLVIKVLLHPSPPYLYHATRYTYLYLRYTHVLGTYLRYTHTLGTYQKVR